MEPEVRMHGHKSLPLDIILNQMKAVYILTHYFFKINFNINLPTMHKSPM
jgi:hypothetical protein